MGLNAPTRQKGRALILRANLTRMLRRQAREDVFQIRIPAQLATVRGSIFNDNLRVGPRDMKAITAKGPRRRANCLPKIYVMPHTMSIMEKCLSGPADLVPPKRKRQRHPWQETRPPCLPLSLRPAFLSKLKTLTGDSEWCFPNNLDIPGARP